MIVKINDRTPAHLERLEKFFNSGNWVHVPKQLFIKPMSDDELREYEHKFAKVLRKTKTSKAGSADRFTITLEISPYVYDEGGCQVKVPAKYLLDLMQALDLFSPDFERENIDLL